MDDYMYRLFEILVYVRAGYLRINVYRIYETGNFTNSPPPFLFLIVKSDFYETKLNT